MKNRDQHGLELERADSKIREAELALGHFDADLEAVDRETETAAEVAYQADSALEDARGEREKIQEDLDKTTARRHDLHVCNYNTLVTAYSLAFFD